MDEMDNQKSYGKLQVCDNFIVDEKKPPSSCNYKNKRKIGTNIENFTWTDCNWISRSTSENVKVNIEK